MALMQKRHEMPLSYQTISPNFRLRAANTYFSTNYTSFKSPIYISLLPQFESFYTTECMAGKIQISRQFDRYSILFNQTTGRSGFKFTQIPSHPCPNTEA